VACLAIPMIALGGAIPGALGVGGGLYCLAVSREAKRTTRQRLIHCSSAVAVSWILFLALFGGVAILTLISPNEAEPRAERKSTIRPIESKSTSRAADPAEFADANEASRIQTTSLPGHEPEADALDKITRRKIYARATSLLDDIESAKQRKRKVGSEGLKGEVARTQLEHIQGMHESRQDFTENFYKITRSELDEIIDEGDRKRWPRG